MRQVPERRTRCPCPDDKPCRRNQSVWLFTRRERLGRGGTRVRMSAPKIGRPARSDGFVGNVIQSFARWNIGALC